MKFELRFNDSKINILPLGSFAPRKRKAGNVIANFLRKGFPRPFLVKNKKIKNLEVANIREFPIQALELYRNLNNELATNRTIILFFLFSFGFPLLTKASLEPFVLALSHVLHIPKTLQVKKFKQFSKPPN